MSSSPGQVESCVPAPENVRSTDSIGLSDVSNHADSKGDSCRGEQRAECAKVGCAARKGRRDTQDGRYGDSST
eukprot:515403-Pleurochrysis_carterae.AAC.1